MSRVARSAKGAKRTAKPATQNRRRPAKKTSARKGRGASRKPAARNSLLKQFASAASELFSVFREKVSTLSPVARKSSAKKSSGKRPAKRAAKSRQAVKSFQPHAMGSWRFYFVLCLLGVAATALVGRLVVLQVSDTEYGQEFLLAQGEARSVRTEILPAHRGMIRDRNGEPLAVSTPVQTLWSDPRILSQHPERWHELAIAVGVDPKKLSGRVERLAQKSFMYIKRRMPPDEANAVLALGIPGVYSRQEYRRFYPAGEVTAQLVGFTNIDEVGQEGLELSFEEWLQGEPGAKKVLRNRKGETIRDISSIKSPQPGRDLTLSIDLRLQYLAYRELKQALLKTGAASGSVVVLDVETGDVLAMVNGPSYNPNNRSSLKPEALRNRAITDLFEPGSTMKPFTVLAAMETGEWDENSIINTNPGYIRVERKTLLDHRNYGKIDLEKLLQKSSQVGTTKLALSMEGSHLRDVFFRAGMGQDTGLGFPGESSGTLPFYRKWRKLDQAAFSFGHGLATTPLQLARAYSVIASDGELKPVHLIRKENAAQQGERVFEQDLVSKLRHMMYSVTLPGGTATRARVDGYKIGGKTGTVHKVGASGYEASRYVAMFAGFAPLSDPKIVTVVVVDDPKGDRYYGGEVAAPVFAGVMEGALRILNIPHDDLEKLNVNGSAVASAGER